MNSLASSLAGALPPAYTVIDTGNPDGALAVSIATDIMRKCSAESADHQSHLDKQKLSSVLEMVIRHIQDETGVLPSVTSTVSANNPRNPDQWSWNEWESNLFPSRNSATNTIPISILNKICKPLTIALNGNGDKLIALLEHDVFKASLKPSMISAVSNHRHVKFHAEQDFMRSPSNMFGSLFRQLEVKGAFRPTGLIRAAISLGYLTESDINEIFALSKR